MKIYIYNIKIFLLHLILVFIPVLANAQTYTWKNAPIGGGGFVTGIITHPTSGDRYCRTDIGGAYRWDAENNKWVQLLDWLSESESGFYGVESLALDPQNPNNVYMLCGTEYLNNGRTAILKSTDKGNTFTYTDVTSKFKTHGNGYGRGNGERLAVDPKNSNILFCGTRANGLWKSTDAGVTWNLAWNGVTTTSNGNGISFVAYDPLSTVVNGVTQTIYIGVSRIGSANIYKSTDGGVTFTDISPNTGFMPHRVALQGTTMYATFSVDEGPDFAAEDYSGTTPANDMGRVYKLNTSTGIWTNVTPVHHPTAMYSYGGVSIDPSNINRILVSTCGMYWNPQFSTQEWGDFIFLSTDAGTSWTLKINSSSTYDNNGMGWAGPGAINWMDCIEFDLYDPLKVRVIGGGGVYTCSDITAANTSWKNDVIGIEETALLDGVSIPEGPFISSFGDVSGFVHEPLTSVPSKKLSPLGGHNNHSIAYAAANPSKVVRIGNGENVVYYSNDKGATWTAAATNMGSAGRADISADGGTILHCPWGSTTTWYSTNNGGSWSSCSGVSLQNAAPVADKVNSNYFYIYQPKTGEMLRSSNKGVNFSLAGTPGASTADYPWEPVMIRTVPGFEGHIWVPLAGNGLKYSTNSGATYTTVANVTYCKSIGIGKAMSGASYPTIFIWGTVSGVNGLFRSTDQGATWLRMNDDEHEFGGAPLLVGDMNVAGRVYMGAGGGRGLIYWDAVACTPTSITPYVQINGGSWEQTASASLNAGGTVQFGPQPTTGGSWNWSGPNNFSATTREVTIANIQSNLAGNYVATYTNSGGCQSEQAFNVTVTTSSGGGTGTILREYWTGISGTSISNLTSNANYPNTATGSSQLTSLEGPTNWADNYGTRIRGYIHPTITGSYTFWVAGDDNVDLYLSTDDNPGNKSRIAYVEGWANSRDWNKYTTQQSASRNLVAGRKYYIEVLHKEAGGGDNVAVAWQGPGISQQVIGGSYLSAFDPAAIVVRARGTQGGETVDLRLNGNTVATWTLTTVFANYTASGSGDVTVHFTNDNGPRDVQVDYVIINGTTYQSENQPTNTGVWQNTCGGSFSEWLNCGGFISYTTSGNPSARNGSTLTEKSSESLSSLEPESSSLPNIEENEINIFPNPADHGKFTVALPEIGNATISIFDSQGRLLYEKITNGDSGIEIDSGLKAGIYFIKVKSGRSYFPKKLIVH